MFGEVRVVDDVPSAFVDVVRDVAPRTFAVSGGDTARRCYEALATADDIVWHDAEVLVGDERWVPVDHADSNERMARAALLDRVGVAAVHSMRGAGDTLEEAADAFDRLVAGLQPLDLVHLGLGEDAHTASLFPGAPSLDVQDRQVVAAGDDLHEWPRLTLTFPAIAASRLAVVTVEGAEKREAWARVRAGDDVPAARVRARNVLWLLDRAAAG